MYGLGAFGTIFHRAGAAGAERLEALIGEWLKRFSGVPTGWGTT